MQPWLPLISRAIPTRTRSWLSPWVVRYFRWSSSIAARKPIFQEPNIAAILKTRNSDGLVASDQSVSLHGWVRSVRKQKQVAFAVLGDGSTTEPLQVVLEPSQAKELFPGSSIKVVGRWRACAPDQQQRFEVLAQQVEVLGSVDSKTYPLQKKHQTPEHLRTIPHLRHRTTFATLLLRLRSQTTSLTNQFFERHSFLQTHPPIITSSDCEGAGEAFTLEPASSNPNKEIGPGVSPILSLKKPKEQFFRDPKYLTVSTQLHLEALAQAVGRVWTLSPTFRAERSDTARHLSEFYMLEAELTFTSELEDVMALVEELIRSIAVGLKSSPLSEDLRAIQRYGEGEEKLPLEETSSMLKKRWEGLVRASWPRITYTEAVHKLEEDYNTDNPLFDPPPSWGEGLSSSHERYLAGSIGQGSPIFVTDYPSSIKPFYMLPSTVRSPRGKTVAAFDLLLPEQGEVAGGSLREHRYDALMDAMQAKGLVRGEGKQLSFGSLQWYVDLRKWGTVPHGGFGVGFDRLLAYLAGVGNVRETSAFPRWYGRCLC